MLGLIGVILVATIVLFGKAAISRGDAIQIAAGQFLWLWCAGGVALMLVHLARTFVS